jgi:hypothetical protein
MGKGLGGRKPERFHRGDRGPAFGVLGILREAAFGVLGILDEAAPGVPGMLDEAAFGVLGMLDPPGQVKKLLPSPQRKVEIRLYGKGNSKGPRRKAGQPSHLVDVVDSDQ